MTYNEFKEVIQVKRLPLDRYYKEIVTHKEEILREVVLTSQKEVASKLNLAPSQFTPVINILKVLSRDEDK